MIPDDLKNQIRDATDIVAVIGQHVQLRKAGRSWKGLCPFHGEKTPSFNVTPERQSFICFGCGKKGDVFTFIMEIEGKSFMEALEQCAQRASIELPKIEESPELRRARGERAAMLAINKLATAFYRDVLADPKRGEAGRAYLAKRGVQQAITDKFQLGYAPAAWSALADHLKAQRVDMEIAMRVGLIAPRKSDASYYDRFRDRLVCPVIVPGGDVVGFSCRVIGPPPEGSAGDPPPKYVNSPESSVYKKSKLLFGLAQARDSLHALKRCVLVEGNFDVITLHQAGFTEVVAPLGTALTIEQVNQLKRMTERIVLLYDGDRAGYKATMHALMMCVEAEVEVQVAARPGHGRSGGAGPLADGVDPDSLVAGGGTAQLKEAIDRAQGGIEFFAFEVWAKARGNSDARSRALGEAARLIAKVASAVKRDLIIATLATALEVDVGVVRAEVARASGQGSPQGYRQPNHAPHPNYPSAGRPVDEPAPAPAVLLPVPLDELQVMVLLADHPELIATPEADKAFWLLTDARLQAMYSAARAGQSLHELLSNPVAAQLPPSSVELVLSKQREVKDPRRELARMIDNLDGKKGALAQRDLGKNLAAAKRGNDRELQRKLAQLAEAERKGDRELVARITASLGASLADETNGKKGD